MVQFPVHDGQSHDRTSPCPGQCDSSDGVPVDCVMVELKREARAVGNRDHAVNGRGYPPTKIGTQHSALIRCDRRNSPSSAASRLPPRGLGTSVAPSASKSVHAAQRLPYPETRKQSGSVSSQLLNQLCRALTHRLSSDSLDTISRRRSIIRMPLNNSSATRLECDNRRYLQRGQSLQNFPEASPSKDDSQTCDRYLYYCHIWVVKQFHKGFKC